MRLPPEPERLALLSSAGEGGRDSNRAIGPRGRHNFRRPPTQARLRAFEPLARHVHMFAMTLEAAGLAVISDVRDVDGVLWYPGEGSKARAMAVVHVEGVGNVNPALVEQ